MHNIIKYIPNDYCETPITSVPYLNLSNKDKTAFVNNLKLLLISTVIRFYPELFDNNAMYIVQFSNYYQINQ